MYLFREVRQRTAWLRRSASDRLAQDREHRKSAEAAYDAYQLLQEVHAFTRPNEKRIAKAATSFVAGYIDRIEGAVRTVRADLAIVRQDLGSTLRSLGPDVARLEALDDSLQKATVARTMGLYKKFGASLGARFGKDLNAHLALVPKGIDASAAEALVRRWHAEGGLFHKYYELFDGLLRMLVDLECQSLEVMVDSALELAAKEQAKGASDSEAPSLLEEMPLLDAAALEEAAAEEASLDGALPEPADLQESGVGAEHPSGEHPSRGQEAELEAGEPEEARLEAELTEEEIAIGELTDPLDDVDAAFDAMENGSAEIDELEETQDEVT